MQHTFAKVVLFIVLTSPLCSFAAQTPIAFGIDCMIHGADGAMLADLGMVGKMGSDYVNAQSFQYQDLQIEASLNGPFTEAPEVVSPQLKLTVLDSQGHVLAAAVTSATATTNTALFIPAKNLYLHCDKSEM